MGEIKNTHGASSIEDRALAEGEDATAASSLRDGDPSHGLPNYAGRRDVDEACAAELNFASIEVGSYEFCREQGEVKTAIVGSLHGWSFKRAWRYWVATGPGIELSVAEALHEAHGRAVRVEGHCGCPSPREWNQGLATGHYHVDTLAGLRALADTIRGLVERAKSSAPGIETGTATTEGRGPKGESPIREADAPESRGGSGFTLIHPSRMEPAIARPDPTSGGEAPGRDEGWQPIETAPTDGTMFWALEERRGPSRAQYICWRHTDDRRGAWYWQDEADSEPDPTHWRPLPTAPRPSQREG